MVVGGDGERYIYGQSGAAFTFKDFLFRFGRFSSAVRLARAENFDFKITKLI